MIKFIKMGYLKYFCFAMIFIFLGCSEGNDVTEVIKVPDEVIPEKEPEKQEEFEVPEHNALLGTLCGFEGDLRKGKNYKGADRPTTYYNVPLFEPVPEGSEEGWWDNLVEELAYSGVDYVAANCRGLQPSYPKKYVDHGDPTKINELVAAMERRGVADKFKIAIFDDCPASWEAARNMDLGRGYAGYSANNPEKRKPYPLNSIAIDSKEFQDSIYQYIWDYNIRLAFQNIPEKYLFKYNDRPVVYFWGCSFVGDAPGKLAYILKRIREDCKKEFAMDPLLVIDQDWIKRDNTLTSDRANIGGINNWFNMTDTYTVRTFNDLTIGVGIPGFLVNDLKEGANKMFVDARHGKQLQDALKYCVQNKSDIILLEGFTDVLENAAYWRSTDKVYYDYPNQRINILRKWSSNPYPKEFRVEVEACDSFEDKSSGNSVGKYRKGNLDIKKCNDKFEGWCVTETEAGEYMKWVELPFRDGKSVVKLRYASQVASKICMNIDGKEGESVDLANTGGSWQEAEVAVVNFEKKGWREVVLKIISGNVDLNYFTILSE